MRGTEDEDGLWGRRTLAVEATKAAGPGGTSANLVEEAGTRWSTADRASLGRAPGILRLYTSGRHLPDCQGETAVESEVSTNMTLIAAIPASTRTGITPRLDGLALPLAVCRSALVGTIRTPTRMSTGGDRRGRTAMSTITSTTRNDQAGLECPVAEAQSQVEAFTTRTRRLPSVLMDTR